MKLPISLDSHLDYCREAGSDQALTKLLNSNLSDLVLFLESAFEEEAWMNTHAEFMKQSLSSLTTQFFQDKLEMSLAQRVARGIRSHYEGVRRFLSFNLELQLKDCTVAVNSLLMGALSQILREKIRRECRDLRRRDLLLKEVTFKLFASVQGFMEKGSIETIYSLTREEKIEVLKIAHRWDLHELSQPCEHSLSLYLNRENILEVLGEAHQNQWIYLRQACIQMLNDQNLGFQIFSIGSDQVSFEFFEFQERGIAVFEQVRAFITHLIFGGSLAHDSEFSSLVGRCPRLISLNFSHTESYSDHLQVIPPDLQELNLSYCTWLDNHFLDKMIQICPHLRKLSLTGNLKLDFEGWGALTKLPVLQALELTRCSQVGDEDLKLILEGCPELKWLSLEECRGITDQGFLEMTAYHSSLIFLNLARCQVSDLPLVEIANHSPLLTTLNLMRCESITERGVLEAVRLLTALKEINLSHCHIPPVVIEEIQRRRPFLTVITEYG